VFDREYIVIRNPKFIDRTYKEPIIDFIIQTKTTTKPIATEKLKNGQVIWLKWKNGPIVLKAEVDYWKELTDKKDFHYTLIKLKNQKILDDPIITTKTGQRSSWIVIDDFQKRIEWFGNKYQNDKDSCPIIPLKKNRKIKLKAFMDKIIPVNDTGIKLQDIYLQVFNEFGEECREDILCPHDKNPEYKHAIRSVLDVESKKGNYLRLGNTFWIKITERKSEIIITSSADNTPPRSTMITTRIIRDSKIAQELKALYQNKYQICNTSFQYLNKKSSIIEYSEACHIRPVGQNHNGHDKKNNILILCPNHHAMFDLGTIAINPEDGKSIIYLFGSNYTKEEKIITLLHNIDYKNIIYHFTKIFNNGETWEE